MSRGFKTTKCVVVLVGLLLCLLGGIFLLFNFSVWKTAGRTIPKIEITLADTTLDEINSGPKRLGYPDNKMTLNDGKNKYYFDNVEIRGRGNASWMMNKKSYRIKLTRKVNLLGLGKIKKWAMISNYTDNSMIRNALGNFIADLLYDDYPIQGEFINFTVDGKNLGLYYMSELVTVDKSSVDLKDPFGILVELDDVYYETEEKYYVTKLNDHITIGDVTVEDNKDEAMGFFMDDYNIFEKAVKSGDYELMTEVVDAESFAKYYLLGEFSSNLDAYMTSWYLYKDGEEDKIHSNIGWDFDGAFGNRRWWEREGDDLYSPTELMTRMKYTVDGWNDYAENDVNRCDLLYEVLASPTMCYMIGMPEFRELVAEIYQKKLMGKREEIVSYIRNTADYIRDEAIADNELWGKGDFDEEVEYLVWWVDKRFDYFNDLYGGGWPEPIEL